MRKESKTRGLVMLAVGLLMGLATFVVGADVALAHHADISGAPHCSTNGETYTVTWTVVSIGAPEDVTTWTIDGTTKSVFENFTFTVTYNLGSGPPQLTKSVTWENGYGAQTTGTSYEPETCIPPTTTAPPTTTTVPETTTTVPETTTTVPETTTTVAETTTTVAETTTTTAPATTTTQPATTTTQPSTTTASSVASEPPVTPPSSSAVAQEPPVLTTPPGAQLPVTGSSNTSDALTIGFVLVSLGGLVMFARRRPNQT